MHLSPTTRIINYKNWTGGFVLLTLILLLTSGCNSPISQLYPVDPTVRSLPVFIISHGWHTGIAIRKVHLGQHLPKHPRMPQTTYLMFGWGDGNYYPHPDPGTGLLLRAALLPTESVLHVVGFNNSADQYFPSSRIIKVMIHKKGAENLAMFISNHFVLDESGNAVFATEGLYQNSAFFKAKPYYFFPRTSNRWVAQALRRTGYPIAPFFAITSGNVMKQASKYGEVIQ